MTGRATIDTSDMRARLRPPRHTVRSAAYVSRPSREPSHKLFQDVTVVDDFHFPVDLSRSPIAKTTTQPSPQRQSVTATPHKPEPSRVLMRQPFTATAPTPVQVVTPIASAVPTPMVKRVRLPRLHKKLASSIRLIRKAPARFWAMPLQQRMLTSMAAFVFVAGAGISLSGYIANNAGKLKVAQASIAGAESATSTGSDSGRPSTAPISGDTLRAYQVAPDMPRYIRIGKIGVFARVLQAGVTKDGALATPSNVFDAAWYKGSAKPGEPGAALIDGHVSSWTTNGVFFGLKKLAIGDSIEIERGDGKKLSYSIVKTKTFSVDNVDMASLLVPATPGSSGLNLITCSGKYDSKTDHFTERLAVYATLN